jgi:hypothetical protein
MGKLQDIQIDTTMQREPNLQWILTIIENFRAYQAQPIQVYATADGYGAWDGQHTSLALYLIATQALGMNFEDVEVPINIYDIVSRGEIRGNFINNNTTVGKNAGKKPLDIIDIFEQMIYGLKWTVLPNKTGWMHTPSGNTWQPQACLSQRKSSTTQMKLGQSVVSMRSWTPALKW